MRHYDAIVLGAGQAGRELAQKLVQKNQKTAIVTLNDDSASYFERLIHALATGEFPLQPDPHGPPGVDTYRGTPSFNSEKNILSVGGETLTAKKFGIAVGAVPYVPPIQGLLETPFITPLELLRLDSLPKNVTILGGGPVAVMTAQHCLRKGVKPTVVSNEPYLFPKEDSSISQYFQETLTALGAHILLNSSVIQTRALNDTTSSVVIKNNDTQNELQTNSLVLATGLIGNTKGLGLENQRIYLNNFGSVVVNDQMETSAKGFWAAGSVMGHPYNLALEKQQTEIAANNMTASFFSQMHLETDPLPTVVFTKPGFAKLGESQAEAEAKYSDIHTITHTLQKNGNQEGLITLVARKNGSLRGVHILAARAAEMILYFDLVYRAEISLFDLLDRHHFPSPSQGEEIFNAANKWALSI